LQGTREALHIYATDGKTLILKIAEPGEVLHLSATVSGKPYELTAETIDPCEVNFVKREDFLRFLREHSDARFKVAEQLSEKYNNACHEVRSLDLSQSAGEKLAKLLPAWSSNNGEGNKQEPRLKLALTHEEIAQMIGISPLGGFEEAPNRAGEEFPARHSQQSGSQGHGHQQLKFFATTPVRKVTATGDSNHCAFLRRREAEC